MFCDLAKHMKARIIKEKKPPQPMLFSILVNICSKKRQLIKTVFNTSCKITQPAANLLLTVAMVRRNLLAFSSNSGGLAGLKRGNMKNY
ncbi:hypothetical protein T05_6333 [Trichinella murrelli]|uniref:Uncharacterized protein n=1 Tax=Trichinella murrelli TaxID=144512 RepID=A0A0V0TJT8_9BILA|nr:hypothetical protein T05_6333 [Trichinella murrelli]